MGQARAATITASGCFPSNTRHRPITSISSAWRGYLGSRVQRVTRRGNAACPTDLQASVSFSRRTVPAATTSLARQGPPTASFLDDGISQAAAHPYPPMRRIAHAGRRAVDQMARQERPNVRILPSEQHSPRGQLRGWYWSIPRRLRRRSWGGKFSVLATEPMASCNGDWSSSRLGIRDVVPRPEHESHDPVPRSSATQTLRPRATVGSTTGTDRSKWGGKGHVDVVNRRTDPCPIRCPLCVRSDARPDAGRGKHRHHFALTRTRHDRGKNSGIGHKRAAERSGTVIGTRLPLPMSVCVDRGTAREYPSVG
jgi:hypothetical protein